MTPDTDVPSALSAPLSESSPASEELADRLKRSLPGWVPAVLGGLAVGLVCGGLALSSRTPNSKPALTSDATPAQMALAIADAPASIVEEPTATQTQAADTPDLAPPAEVVARYEEITAKLAALPNAAENGQQDQPGRYQTASTEPANAPGDVRLTQGFDRLPATLPSSARRRLIDALIDSELPGITPQERAIWQESLDGLSLQDARGVLQMRSRVGVQSLVQSPSSMHSSSIYSSSVVPPSSESSLQPIDVGTSLKPTPQSSRDRTVAAWQQAAQAARRNLDRQDCFGYLAEWVMLGESEDGESIVVVDRRLHEEPGPAIFTGRPLDLSIEAPAFLKVLHNGQPVLTRYGRLAIDNDTLGVRLPSGFAPLDPPVAIEVPAEASLRFDPQLGTTLLADEDELARVALWTVDDIGALQRAGSAVYAPTDASGQPTPLEEGRVRSKYLTGSNVQAEVESDWLAALQQRLGGRHNLAGRRSTVR